ncbi:MAG: hypothetical protein AAFN78_08510 [Pseudomonadota bacterium]
MTRLLLALCLLLWCYSTVAVAQEEPLVEISVSDETVLVGEALEVTVTVLVPTWFAQPPEFPTLEIANAVTRRPPDSSYPTSRRVGSDTWSGIVRSYEIYPLTAARFELAGHAITISYANPGADPVTTEVALSPIVFAATVPQGAGALDPYLAGTALTFTRDLESPPDALEAGDAVVMVYSAQLTGLPAIFLPPLAPALDQLGLAQYADAPVVEEGPPATRTERVTVVFEGGGEFTLPTVELRWWNTATSEVEVASVPPLTLSVAGPPVAAPKPTGPVSDSRPSLTLMAIAVIVLALACWRGVPAMSSRWHAHRERVKASEPAAFAAAKKALLGGDAHAGHTAVLAWLARFTGDSNLRSFAARSGDEGLRAAVEAFLAAVYSPDAAGTVDGRQLAAALDAARRHHLDRTATGQSGLPPLNPGT